MKNKEFTALYVKYRHLLMKIIFDRTRNLDLAEELSQQVFISFYEKMDNLDNAFYKPWLMLAAKNAAIDHNRKKSVSCEIPAGDGIGYYSVITEDNMERIVERMTNAQLSFRILEDLKVKNETWYDVIEAICVQELGQDEAAVYLQISPQVLRARLYRARKYIRKTYGDEYEEY